MLISIVVFTLIMITQKIGVAQNWVSVTGTDIQCSKSSVELQKTTSKLEEVYFKKNGELICVSYALVKAFFSVYQIQPQAFDSIFQNARLK